MRHVLARLRIRIALAMACAVGLTGCGSHDWKTDGFQSVSDVVAAAGMTNCWYPLLNGRGSDGPADTEKCDQGNAMYSGPLDGPATNTITLSNGLTLDGDTFEVDCYSASWCLKTLHTLSSALNPPGDVVHCTTVVVGAVVRCQSARRTS